MIQEIIYNYYFASIALSWLTAVFLKALVKAVREHHWFLIRDGLANGGMPSVHSAFITAISVAIAVTSGFTDIFYLALVISLIVMADAVKVRKNMGEQGEALNELLKKYKGTNIPIVYGHTSLQVFMGVIIGIIIPLLLKPYFGI